MALESSASGEYQGSAAWSWFLRRSRAFAALELGARAESYDQADSGGGEEQHDSEHVRYVRRDQDPND
jgi:hypothetical protein